MSRRHHRAQLGVLAMLLVACSAPPPAPDPTTTPVAADAELDINAQPRERLRDGGLARLPLVSLPTQWNPRHPDAAEASTQRLLAVLSPSHFTLDAAGRPSANPDFVSGVDVQHGESTVVTLDLVDGAVWGDGGPVTAADWVAAWQVGSGQVAGAHVLDTAGWERVKEVRAGDSPRQVVITYAGIVPDWAEPLVAGPARAASTASAEAFSWGTPDKRHYAGPFLVAHVDKTQGLVTLERNPRWWGDQPKLERIMFRTVQAQAVAAAFQHNELDVWETGTSSDRLQQTRAASDTTLRSAPGRSGRALHVSRSGVLADVAVRRALLLALDRTLVGPHDLADVTKPPRTWSSNLLLPTQPGYVDQARATGLGGDPDQAAKALDEAGWALESRVRVKDGQPLELTFRAERDDELATSEFIVLADQLARVGVRLRAVPGDADLVPVTVRVSAFPLARLPEEMASAPGASDLVARVGAEVDPVRRADQASQLARLLWQEVVEIPLYQVPQFVAVRNGLANLGAPGFATTDWEDVGWTS